MTALRRKPRPDVASHLRKRARALLGDELRKHNWNRAAADLEAHLDVENAAFHAVTVIAELLKQLDQRPEEKAA